VCFQKERVVMMLKPSKRVDDVPRTLGCVVGGTVRWGCQLGIGIRNSRMRMGEGLMEMPNRDQVCTRTRKLKPLDAK
jgi:hypothetical protein